MYPGEEEWGPSELGLEAEEHRQRTQGRGCMTTAAPGSDFTRSPPRRARTGLRRARLLRALNNPLQSLSRVGIVTHAQGAAFPGTAATGRRTRIRIPQCLDDACFQNGSLATTEE